jgi:hypothetical protein
VDLRHQHYYWRENKGRGVESIRLIDSSTSFTPYGTGEQQRASDQQQQHCNSDRQRWKGTTDP